MSTVFQVICLRQRRSSSYRSQEFEVSQVNASMNAGDEGDRAIKDVVVAITLVNFSKINEPYGRRDLSSLRV